MYYDIDYARQLFVDRGYELLESEYVSTTTPMRYICICGEMRQIPLKRLMRGEGGCKPCSIKRRAAKRRFSLPDAKAMFLDSGFMLLELEYLGALVPLRTCCINCGSVRLRRLAVVKSHGCKDCADKAKGLKFRKGIDYANKYFAALNLELLEEQYVNNHTPMLFRCRVCGKRGKTDLKSVSNGHGCSTCGIKKRSGPNHPRWIVNRKERALRKKVVEKCLDALKHCRKRVSTLKVDHFDKELGYTPRQLQEHIIHHPNWAAIDPEGEWHLDHIIPIKAFLEHNIRDLKLINALDNLQPLPGPENLKKVTVHGSNSMKSRGFCKAEGRFEPQNAHLRSRTP